MPSVLLEGVLFFWDVSSTFGRCLSRFRSASFVISLSALRPEGPWPRALPTSFRNAKIRSRNCNPRTSAPSLADCLVQIFFQSHNSAQTHSMMALESSSWFNDNWFHSMQSIPRAKDKIPKSMCSNSVIHNWVHVVWEKIQLSHTYSFIHSFISWHPWSALKVDNYDLRLAKRPPAAASSFSNALIGCKNHIFLKQLQHIVFYVYGEKQNAFSNILK
jgi:hypothetical protein